MVYESLVDFLDRALPSDRSEYGGVLTAPWCRPQSGKQLAAWTRLQRTWALESVSKPSPGEAMLVSREGYRAAGLWYLRVDVPPSPRQLRKGSLSSEMVRAWRLAKWQVDFLPSPSQVRRRPRWRAFPIALGVPDQPVEGALVGGSMGLALALSGVSHLMHQSMPVAVVALAAMDDSGRTRPVNDLLVKVGHLVRWAPQVKTLLVADRQPARELTEATRRFQEVCVKPVRTLAQAVDVVWPNLAGSIFFTWNSVLAHRVLDEMLSLVGDGYPALATWDGIRRTAESIESFFPEGSVEKKQARFCREVSDLKDGHPRLMGRPPEDLMKTFIKPVQLEWWTHWVLSHEAAATKEEVKAAVRRASDEVASRELRGPADNKLLGAMGRILAVAGFFDRAQECLERALAGWVALRDFELGCEPLCEYLRVLALQEDRKRFEAVLDDLAERVRRSTASPVDQAFLALAEGRGWVLFGEFERAMEAFDEEIEDDIDEELGVNPWAEVPRVEAARHRWRAKALDGQGAFAEAVREREVLRASRACTDLPMMYELAQLDRALFLNQAPIIDWAAKSCLPLQIPREHSRIELERLAREYPY